MQLILTCNSGTESLLKKEIVDLNIKINKVEDRLIFCEGDEYNIVDINLWSRVGNKVYILLGKSDADNFNDLFEFIYSFDWKFFIDQGQNILVVANSIDSTLSSIPTIQSIGKKAIVKKLLNGKEGLLNEDKNSTTIEINITINKNQVFLLLNTTGNSLHQRGYKKNSVQAPLKENLAAGIILLSKREYDKPFFDLFCGGGTIPIEAALISRNIAPGLLRDFAYESFKWFDKNIIINSKYLAKQKIINRKFKIIGTDIDKKCIEISKKNAILAGVIDSIDFKVEDFQSNDLNKYLDCHIVSNPPYGIRIKDNDLVNLYKNINSLYEKKTNSGGILTGFEYFAKIINKNNWKLRKLYNGGEKCYFYTYQKN